MLGQHQSDTHFLLHRTYMRSVIVFSLVDSSYEGLAKASEMAAMMCVLTLPLLYPARNGTAAFDVCCDRPLALQVFLSSRV